MGLRTLKGLFRGSRQGVAGLTKVLKNFGTSPCRASSRCNLVPEHMMTDHPISKRELLTITSCSLILHNYHWVRNHLKNSPRAIHSEIPLHITDFVIHQDLQMLTWRTIAGGRPAAAARYGQTSDSQVLSCYSPSPAPTTLAKISCFISCLGGSNSHHGRSSGQQGHDSMDWCI